MDNMKQVGMITVRIGKDEFTQPLGLYGDTTTALSYSDNARIKSLRLIAEILSPKMEKFLAEKVQ